MILKRVGGRKKHYRTTIGVLNRTRLSHHNIEFLNKISKKDKYKLGSNYRYINSHIKRNMKTEK